MLTIPLTPHPDSPILFLFFKKRNKLFEDVTFLTECSFVFVIWIKILIFHIEALSFMLYRLELRTYIFLTVLFKITMFGCDIWRKVYIHCLELLYSVQLWLAPVRAGACMFILKEAGIIIGMRQNSFRRCFFSTDRGRPFASSSAINFFICIIWKTIFYPHMITGRFGVRIRLLLILRTYFLFNVAIGACYLL